MADAIGSTPSLMGGFGMATYGQTVSDLKRAEGELSQQFSQGLLQMQSQAQLNALALQQNSSKYGISPADQQAAQLALQTEQFQIMGQLQAGYELGQEQLEIPRENLEFARQVAQEPLVENFNLMATQGILTQEDFTARKELSQALYGENDPVD